MLKNCKDCTKEFEAQAANAFYCATCKNKRRLISVKKAKNKYKNKPNNPVSKSICYAARDSGYF